jgi:hypothetical protein
MRRSAIRLGMGTAVVAAALAMGAAPALADQGAPGSTFPEQPNGHVATGCAAIATNPGTSLGGHARFSEISGPITFELLTDACGG